jgi:hypothetical protein
MTSKGNKFILEKFISNNQLQVAQKGTEVKPTETIPGGKDIKVRYSDGTIKTLNTGSPEYVKMYNTGQIQTEKGIANDTWWGGNLEDVVVKQQSTPLSKFRSEYGKKNTREDFVNKKKDEYIKGLGKSNWYGIDRNNFPEQVLNEINQNYDYNRNTYALEQLAKKGKFDLNERGAWVDNLTAQEKNALINSKYSSQLNPDELANTVSGIQQLVNTALPGKPLSFDVPGFTPKENKEDAEAKLSGLKVFSLLNTPGNYIANAAKNNTMSSYGNFREKPTLGIQRMGNVSEMESVALNPVSYEALASLPKLAQAGYKFIKSAPEIARNIPEALNSLRQTAKKTFTPTREADLSGIERLSGQLRESSIGDIEEIRSSFHNSSRFLTPEEIDLLRVRGRGAVEDYRLPPEPGPESLQAGLTGVPDTQTSFNYTTQESLDRLNAGMRLEPEHVQRLGYETGANNLSFEDTQRFQRYLIDNRDAGRSTLMGGLPRPNSLDPTVNAAWGNPTIDPIDTTWGTGNWNPNARTVIDINDPNYGVYTPKPRNLSGHTKDDFIMNHAMDDVEKERVLNMPDEEFNKTFTNPKGQVVPSVDGPSISQMTYAPDHGMIVSDAVPMSKEEYAQLFNDNVDRLNEIIALNNKTGVQYKVDRLHPNGQLQFSTPEQVITVPNTYKYKAKLHDVSDDPNAPSKFYAEYSTGPEHMDVEFFDTKEAAETFIEQLHANKPSTIESKIDAGTTSWATDINPARWEGQVEDIANDQYYKSIPGLNMSSTGQSVFADRMARQGSGAYRSINEFLKELQLGRVKPGFNIQTPYSKGAWEKFIQKGEAVGHYGNPSTVYGTFKRKGGDTMNPYNEDETSDFQKYVMKEMGGMLYANKDAGLPHEQSVAKYLSAQNNLLNFMKRIKVVGGPVPFDEYYRENIINPRNKL